MFLKIEPCLHFESRAYAELNYFQIELFLTLKLYSHQTKLFIIELF